MDKGLVTLIGMSIAYVASFLGLGLAWWSWRKRQRKDEDTMNEALPAVSPLSGVLLDLGRAGGPVHGLGRGDLAAVPPLLAQAGRSA